MKKHGHTSRTWSSPTYNSWHGMIARCADPNRPEWHNYGGRGIKVCKRWLDFRNFLKDMGERPPGTWLDRKNNDGNYTPSNCRWATPSEQQINKRVIGYYADKLTLKKRYRVRIKFKGRVHQLGYFSTPEAASQAREDAKRELLQLESAVHLELP